MSDMASVTYRADREILNAGTAVPHPLYQASETYTHTQTHTRTHIHYLGECERPVQFEQDHGGTVAHFRLHLVELHDTVWDLWVIADQAGLVLKVVAVKVNHGEKLRVDV